MNNGANEQAIEREEPLPILQECALPDYDAAVQEVIVGIGRRLVCADDLLSRISQPEIQFDLAEQVVVGEHGEARFDNTKTKTQLTFPFDAAIEGDYEAVLLDLVEGAEANAEALSKAMFSGVDRMCEATGQVATGGMTTDTLLDMIEKMPLEFNEDGSLKSELTIVAGPSQAENFARLEATPEQQRRYAEIMRRKWEEWSARRRPRRLS